ncbi:DUF4192 domain-containing protein [Blastococcus sp. PRF04-17]|uniref:DUF4192 domain-containing protein n=1 Tax=Blastococcus sp. PRF04-17 TaxID=2933797 RepID=UPI001FF4393D|nr:DUF4192 domain-containing protein [Blastococcus sp. PRF04-17]UOY02014.1 DUF4192 domain-containing protein [Blastococcus sp. PRF04-17]
MDASARPVPSPRDLFSVRLSRTAEIAAALPQLLGFRPRESLVLVALAEPDGGRVGLTVRVDLPPEDDAPAVARLLAEKVCTDDPRGVVVAVVSDDPDDVSGGPDLPHRRLVWEVVTALARHSVVVPETLLVRAGRWWSYDCPRPCCEPGEGTPLPHGVTALEAAAVVDGTAVAGSREELAGRLGWPPGSDRRAMARVSTRIAGECAAAIAEHGFDAFAEASWNAVTAALARCRPQAAAPVLSDDDVARILWGLRDVAVRDRALELALGPDAPAAELLWTECTRRGLAPLDAAPATLLAVSAWLRGDGAMANIALARALDSRPDYVLATLLAEGLARCLPPTELRTMIRASLDGCGVDRVR